MRDRREHVQRGDDFLNQADKCRTENPAFREGVGLGRIFRRKDRRFSKGSLGPRMKDRSCPRRKPETLPAPK
jgi:hypothetical protein